MRALHVFILSRVLIAAGLLATMEGNGQIRLPAIISDSMILQRDVKLKVWGWSAAGEKIVIRFNNKTYKTKADAAGNWKLQLPAMKAGGPYSMTLSASNTITLRDILVGDVWLCSGQSNMEHYMSQHQVLYADEIAKADYSSIRQFKVPGNPDLQGPRQDVFPTSWKWAGPANINSFSAVGYFFAREIFHRYNVPVGIINASVGGTPIEAWTDEEGLKEFPGIQAVLQKNKDTAYINGLNRQTFSGIRSQSADKGLLELPKWFEQTYQAKQWRSINIPGYWEDQGIKDLNGVVWYRRELVIPASMAGKAARMFMGRIVDADMVYLNGQQIGNTTYQYPQRRYNIPPGLLKTGNNLVVIRVSNTNGKGGFVPDKPYYLFAGSDTVDLKGTWQYKVGEVYSPRAGTGAGISAQNQPAALYNGMIAPVTNYAVKGFLWYQGESNTSRAAEYAKLQQAQITGWRKKWNMGDLPFLFVQLPGFMDYNYLPSESQWAALREAQLQSLRLANTAMAIAIDLGEWNDIHPDNKKDVGLRLSVAAQKIAYGENRVYMGPLLRLAEVNGDTIILSFDHAGSGLITLDGDALSEISIAGADKKFVWARARIEGDKIIVWNDAIKSPLYVRYAWADNPVNPNLYNKEGLPASPFRTDQ